jgi:hypothetical protein
MAELNVVQPRAAGCDAESRYSLWHLFVAEEIYKMSTFMRGGLWCAELNSITSFEGDVEGTQPFGLFVSCWHRSKDVPTPRAWEIFGGSGNGFALRAQPSFMESFVGRFSGDRHSVRFDHVRYLPEGEKPSDAAFEVTSLNKREEEEEMRVAVSFPAIADLDSRNRIEQIKKCIPTICSNPHEVPKFENVTFAECEGAEAVILPVSPLDLIQEILIGPRVSGKAKNEMSAMLKKSELASRVRA